MFQGCGFSIKQLQKRLHKTQYKSTDFFSARIPYHRISNLPEVCMDWILDFLGPDSGCFQQD